MVGLPHVYIGDTAYPLTTYLIKPYGRRTFARTKAIFIYRLSHAQHIVVCTFGICASKWRILVKASEKKTRYKWEIVQRIALLHKIITHVEGLHEFLSLNECDSLDANPSIQFKKSRISNSVTTVAKQM
jgi:hypothetical protein